MPSQDELKKQVGYQAIDDYVTSGMKVGLGTGSTAAFAVERLGMLLKDGTLKDIIAVPTSVRTKEQAEELGIPLTTLDEFSRLDVAIDGADEVDPDLNLVKGGGGALLREKMVEIVADKFIVIVDESKLCDALGPGFPVRSRRPTSVPSFDATRVHQTRSWAVSFSILRPFGSAQVPVEITPFCHEHTIRVVGDWPALKGKCKPVLRMGSSSNNQNDGDNIAVTDNGNYIVDLVFDKPIEDAPAAAAQLKGTCGVVDHGFFIGMTTAVIIAGEAGISVKTP